MNNYFRLLFVLAIFINSCTDKPAGESDDPQVELEKLDYDRLFTTSDIPAAAKEIKTIQTSENWVCTIYGIDNVLYGRITSPAGFIAPQDPESPDSMPKAVSSAELYIAIADKNGLLLCEQRLKTDLKPALYFAYELPPMAMKQLKKGNHRLTGNCVASLITDSGKKLFTPVENANWSFTYNMPAIYKTVVTFSEFRLTDALYEKSKTNNDGLGNPLPDLFWSFHAGGHQVFRSSTFENSNPYFVEKLSFNAYSTDQNPSVDIYVYDDDYTSFNDKLTQWSGKMASLVAEDFIHLPVKNTDFFRIKASAPQIINP